MNGALARKPALLLSAALALSACASAPPGEDDKGAALKVQATPVLHALVAFRRDHGEYPASLHELAPRYLERLPFEADVELDRRSGVVMFTYELPWPRLGAVACVAPLGAVQWECRGH